MAATQEGQGVTDSLGANVQRLFLNFLEVYTPGGEDDGVEGAPNSQSEPTYVRALRELKEQDRTTLFVDFSHLLECAPALRGCLARAVAQRQRGAARRSAAHAFVRPGSRTRPCRFDEGLAHQAVCADSYRFEPFLRTAVQLRPRRAVRPGARRVANPRMLPALSRRGQNFVTHHHPDFTTDDSGKKEFFVAFVNLPRTHQLRELRTREIGKLVSFSGTVTRTSEARTRDAQRRLLPDRAR